MKTPESAEILDLLGTCLFGTGGLWDCNPPYEITYPPKAPINPDYDVGSFMLTDQKTGKKFVCTLLVREV